MSLKKKAGQIDLAKLVAGVTGHGAVSDPTDHANTGSGMTAIGLQAQSLYQDRKVAEENKLLKAELATWSGATPAHKLDPKLVRPSKWANRYEKSFDGLAWEAFREEILSAGGNVQPIKVRGVIPDNTSSKVTESEGVIPDNTPLPLYEIVFGHRRHRACLELGLPVLALVEDASDRELFQQMDRENRQRADLTIYEQGEMYRHALDDGLYPSLRKLAESLGVGPGNVSEAVQIARLPTTVLDAFESRLDIQRRWAGPLTMALQKDPDVVLAAAAAIQADGAVGQVIKSAEVFKRLIVAGVVRYNTPSPAPISLEGKAGQTGSITQDEAKKMLVVTLKNMDLSRVAELQKLIQGFLG